MLASWTGTVDSTSGGVGQANPVAIGDTVNFQFTYDTSNLGTLNATSNFNLYSLSNASMYSSITVSINGGAAIDFASLRNATSQGEFQQLGLGGPTTAYQTLFDTYAKYGNGYISGH